MKPRRKPAVKRKPRSAPFGIPAFRRAMREGARALESYGPVYAGEAARHTGERAKWLRRAREARRAAVILRIAASVPE